MKIHSLILSVSLVLALVSCAGASSGDMEKETIHFRRDTIIALADDSLFNQIAAENVLISGSKVTVLSGDKKEEYRFSEKYKFDEFLNKNFEVRIWKYKKNVTIEKIFDVYELDLNDVVSIPDDVVGIALRMPNDDVVCIMAFKNNAALMKRAYLKTESYTNKTYVEDFPLQETQIVNLIYLETGRRRSFLLPVHSPDKLDFTKKAAIEVSKKKKHYNLVLQKDSVIMCTNHGQPSKILCEDTGNGSRITIQNADGKGKDRVIELTERYNYKAFPTYKYGNAGWSQNNVTASAAFAMGNGKFLILMQLPGNSETVRPPERVYFEPSPEEYHDIDFRLKVAFDYPRHTLYEIPVYLPKE